MIIRDGIISDDIKVGECPYCGTTWMLSNPPRLKFPANDKMIPFTVCPHCDCAVEPIEINISGRYLSIHAKERKISMNKCQAFKQIQYILEEEANQLAYLLDNGKTDATLKDLGFSHRVEIAIRREIERLRKLASIAEKEFDSMASDEE